MFLLPAQHALPCVLLVVVNPSTWLSQLTLSQATMFLQGHSGWEKVGLMIQVWPQTCLKCGFSEKAFCLATELKNCELAHHVERIRLPGGGRGFPMPQHLSPGSSPAWSLDELGFHFHELIKSHFLLKLHRTQFFP